MGERTELNRERLRPVVHVTSRIEGSDLGTAIARQAQSRADKESSDEDQTKWGAPGFGFREVCLGTITSAFRTIRGRS